RDIYQKAASGDGREAPLVQSTTPKLLWDWSADGRYLVYSAVEGASGTFELWASPLNGDRKPVRIVQSNFNKYQAQVSPDGRWLAYLESTASGSSQIFVQRFQPGGPAGSGESGGKWQ